MSRRRDDRLLAAWHDEIARRLEQLERGDAKLVTWTSAKRQILRSLETPQVAKP